MSSPIHRHVVYSAQFCDAADVVMVAVGAQDRVQFQVVRRQKCQHRLGFAGIHHDSTLVVVDGPDVVVLQCGDGGNVKHGASGA